MAEIETAILLEDGPSRVELRDSDELVCTTSDKKGALVFLVLGVLCLYISIGLMVWRLSRGEIHPPSIGAGIVVFGLGIFLQWRGIRRHRQTGIFHINKLKHTISTPDNRFLTSFGQVKKVFFDFDSLEIVRVHLFPEYPMWLTIEFESGKRVRIAKAPRKLLVPVLNWLITAGIPYSP